MSTTIDEKVVEMRFDGKHFEQNVQTTMSSLDKLKEKMALKGSAKAAVSEFDSYKSGMFSLTDAVNKMWASLEHDVGMRMKGILNSFTIEPLKTGFQEYETQINAVQTILANTSSKGTVLEDVNQALDELNAYADKTIYNFTEMTRNIGTFTAAGVDLDTSVNAIKGIANLAAVSGSTSQQASTAMYQLSQALSSGTVKLMDWNSVVNAGMGGEVFQNALKDTARLHGIAIDQMIEDEGSFRETLKNGWLSSDILTETLNKFTLCVEGAEEGTEEYTKKWNELKASLMEQGYTEAQAEEILKMGKTATEAATKVKTFTQLIDTLKESVQSGWTQTWEILFGDFEEAKEMFTKISDYLGGIIGRISDARNKFLEKVMGTNPLYGKAFESIKKLLDGESLSISKTLGKTLETVTKDLDYYQTLVNKVWRGDYDNGKPRVGLLEGEGHNYKVIQSLVNKGYQYKLTMDDVIEAETKYGDVTKVSTEATEDSAEATAEMIDLMSKLSDEELRNLGLTESEVQLFKDLSDFSKLSGKSMKEVIAGMEGLDGRTMLLESLGVIGTNLVKTFEALGKAWLEVFPPNPYTVWNMIRGFYELTQAIKMTDENVDNIKRTFKGVFALLDIVLTIIGGPIKLVLKGVAKLIKENNVDIFEWTAKIGDAIVNFRDWLDSVLDFTAVFKVFVEIVKKSYGVVKGWVDQLKQPGNAAGDFIRGFINGLKAGFKSIGQTVINLGKYIIEKFKNVLGIHSPSKITFQAAWDFIRGFVNGIIEFGRHAISAIKDFGSDIIGGFSPITSKLIDVFKMAFKRIASFFKEFDINSLISLFGVIGITKMASAIDNLCELVGGFGELLNGIGDGIRDIGKGIKAAGKGFRNYMNSKALLNMAFSIGVLAASLWVLAKIPTRDLWKAVGAVAVLAAIVVALTLAVNKLSGTLTVAKGSGVKLAGIAAVMLSIGASILLIAIAMKKLSSIDSKDMAEAMVGLGLAVAALGSVMLIMKVAGGKAKGVGIKMLGISVALITLLGIIKICDSINYSSLSKGIAAVLALSLMMSIMTAIASIGGSKKGIASAMLGMSISLGIMVGVIKLCSEINPDAFNKGLDAISTLLVMMTTFVLITKIGGHTKGLASTLISLSICVGMLGAIAVVLGMVEPDKLKQGVTAVGILILLLDSLVLACKMMTPDVKSGLLMMSICIGIVAGAAVLIGYLDPGAMKQGVTAMSILMGSMAVLIASTSLLKGGFKTVGILTAMTALVAGLAYVISLIINEVEDPNAAIPIAKAIGELLLAMTVSLSVSSLLVKGLSGLVSTGLLALMTVVVGGLGQVISMLLHHIDDPQEAIPIARSLGELLLAMSIALAITKLTGGGSVSGLKAVGTIATFIVVLEAVAALTGFISSKIKGFDTFLNKGLDMMVRLAEGIGKMVSAFYSNVITGIGDAIAKTLPKLGEGLKSFLTSSSDGLQKLKDVPADAVGKLATITAVIYALVAADFINALTTFFGLREGFSSLGTDLKTFLTNTTDGLKALGDTDIPEDAVDSIDKLASAIGTLISADMKDTINVFSDSGDAFTNFGTAIGSFGEGVKTLVESLSGVKEEDLGVAKIAAEVIKIFAEAAEAIPNDGGTLGDLLGNNNIAVFAEDLKTTAETLLPTVVWLKGTFYGDSWDAGGQEAVDRAVAMIKSFADAAKEIPNSESKGGPSLTGLIVGDNNIAVFANDLSSAAKDLLPAVTWLKATFYGDSWETGGQEAIDNAVATINAFADAADKIPESGDVTLANLVVGENNIAVFANDLQVTAQHLNTALKTLYAVYGGEGSWWETGGQDALNNAVDTVKAFTDASKAIDEKGGIKSWWSGSYTVDKFGEDIAATATYLQQFVTNLGTYGKDEYTKAQYGAMTIKKFAEASQGIGDSGGMGSWFKGDNTINKFAKQMAEAGENIVKMANKFTEIKNPAIMDTAIGIFTSLIDVVKAISGDTDIDGDIDTFASKIDSAAGKIISFAKKVDENSDAMLSARVSIEGLVADLKNSFASVDQELLDDINGFGAALEAAGDAGISKFINTITSEPAKVNGQTAIKALIDGIISQANSQATIDGYVKMGLNLVTYLSQGITDNVTTVTTPFSTMISTTIPNAVKTESNTLIFNGIGRYFVDGIVTGINNNLYKVTNAANSIADTLSSATNSGLLIQSPSRVAAESGMFYVGGLVQGLKDNTHLVDDAGTAVANTLSESIRDRLGIHSNADDGIEAGEFYDGGLAEGLKNGAPKVELEGLASVNLMSSAMKVAAEKESEEVGKTVVDGTVKSIEKNANKTKNKKKVQKAVKKLTEDDIELHKLKIDKANKTYDLWESTDGRDLSDAEKTAEKITNLNSQLADYEAITKIRWEMYQTAVNNKKLSEAERLKAYNEWLDASDEEAEVRNEINNLTKQGVENIKQLQEENRDLEYEAKRQRLENFGSDAAVEAHDLEYYNKLIKDLENEGFNLNEKYQAMVSKFGENSEQAIQAENELLENDKKISDTRAKISDIKEKQIDRDKELKELEFEVQSEYLKQNASAQDQEVHELTYYNKELDDQLKERETLGEKYRQAVVQFGEDSQNAKEAKLKWLENEQEILNIQSKVSDLEEQGLDRMEKRRQSLADKADKDLEYWLLTTGANATEAEKDLKNIEHLNGELVAATEDVARLEGKYNEAVTKYGKESDEALEAWNELRDSQIEEHKKRNEIIDAEKEMVQKEIDALKSAASLKSEKFDLEYKIWENTTGRDATDEEKELQKLEMLKKKYRASTDIISGEYKEYLAAKEEYGNNSLEAQTAYNEYLKAYSDSLETHSDILDLEESIAKREKDLADQREIDKKEYDEYIKKYKKYYEVNGMSLEELEKDAKAVSGYDPNAIAKKTTNAAKAVATGLVSGSLYTGTLTSLSKAGATYADAISTGVEAGTPELNKTANDTANGILAIFQGKTPEWTKCGANIITGLITGINNNKLNLFSIVGSIASSVLTTFTSMWQIHSPSRIFNSFGKYAIMGLANGFSENAFMAIDEATTMADRIKNTISSIADAIDSEIDTEPTIRPVLDMSNIQNGVKNINASLSKSQASMISFSMNKAAADRFRSEEESSTGEVRTVNNNFVQNNYSPKALSSIEIYRQTRNQFARAKEVLQK